MKQERRHPLREQMVPRRPSSWQQYSDRFIRDRRAMDLDVARYMLMDSKKENTTFGSPSKEAYRKHLAVIVFQNRTRILAFKSKPPTLERAYEEVLSDKHQAIALGNTVYLWDGSNGCTSELTTIDEDNGPVTSINWAPDGKHIAVGLNNSDVHLWDVTSTTQLRTLRGGHCGRIPSLAWNSHILTTGGHDGVIINNDVRVRSHIVETDRGHQQEVCGLKWSNSGKQLASGGNDNILHIWDRSISNSSNSPLHRLEDHLVAVKALAWCPFQSNLLASGGGGADRCIKFWNTHTGACINSVDTGSQVCSLLWSKNERELLSSHGFTQNQLTLWKYPSMVKLAELNGHTSRVLFMAQSPDGCTVASAGADETLRFWQVFGAPELLNSKPEAKASFGPFSNINQIR
ncbi:hypothetical protein AMTRI_Chr08g164810 [Amborella trichopoda]